MPDFTDLYNNITTEAHRLGFSHLGVASAFPIPHLDSYLNWVHMGRHASMAYLAREDSLAKRADPRLILPGCQRVICLAMPYQPPQSLLDGVPAGKGRISAYAVIGDYHRMMQEKLSRLENFIRTHAKPSVQIKSYVDTGPILERSYAVQAGIGMVGKNGCLIIQGSGSYFFLAEILTDLDLPVDRPYTRDLCGGCRRCIDACPTDCILPDRTIDSSRCISYLTIENKGTIPNDLKIKVGSWVFGCDACQMACPHNAFSHTQSFPLGNPLLPSFIDLIPLFADDELAFREKFSRTPLARAKRQGILRNAAIVLGNQNFQPALPTLERALEREEDLSIQDACQWALSKIRHG